jgi:peptidoglycan glycosyltransferase
LCALYVAALAFERGREEEAAVVASAAPLAWREPGRRLAEALAARAAGAHVVRDRNGELVGTREREGHFVPASGLDGALVPEPVIAALAQQPPADLRLTLDLSLSRLAASALEGQRGTIVLVEPRTGALLAAVSDPETLRREGPAAFTQRREPASIAKILTAAAAYRAGLDVDAEIARMTCTGVARYAGQALWCASPAGPLAGLDHAMAVSCNVAFADLGVRLGREALVDEFRLWGFDEGAAFFGSAGRIHTVPQRPRQIAALSVGLDVVDITPLHAAYLAAILANDGSLATPPGFAAASGPLGLPPAQLRADMPEPILVGHALTAIRRSMRAVAEYGTGAGLAPGALELAMKTGTAAEWRRGYHVNYIGYAPGGSEPLVAFCVRITHRPSSRAANRAAREAARSLLASIDQRRPLLARASARRTAG